MCVIVVFKAVDMFCFVRFQFRKFDWNPDVIAIVFVWVSECMHVDASCLLCSKHTKAHQCKTCIRICKKPIQEWMPMRMKILRKRTKSRVWVTGAQLECTQRAHTYDIHAFCYIYSISLRCSESKQHTHTHTRTHIECAMCTMQNVLSERWDDNNKKKHTPRSDASFYGFCSLFTKHTTKKKANSEKNRHRFFGPIYFHLLSKYNLVSVLFSERSSQKRIQLKRVPLCFFGEKKHWITTNCFEPLDTKITITFQKTKHKTHLVDFWFEYRLCLFHCMKTLTTLYNCSNSLFLCIFRFTKIFFQFALCSTQRFSFGLILVGNFVG